MAFKRIRASRLENAGQVASEHAEVWRRFKQGKLDGSTASRMSAILVNHRTIIETVKAEDKIAELEAALEAALQGKLHVLKAVNG
jgi:hypothetical protein